MKDLGRTVPQTCRADNLDYIGGMLRIALILLVAALLAGVTGCKNHSGSREYIPGKGWKQN